jgi:hypothetical protein
MYRRFHEKLVKQLGTLLRQTHELDTVGEGTTMAASLIDVTCNMLETAFIDFPGHERLAGGHPAGGRLHPGLTMPSG